MYNKKNKIWVKLMDIGATVGCHQMPERSLFIKGYQLPVCARCTGVMLGQILSIVLYISHIKINITFSIISLSTMVIDGGLQYFNYLKSNNLRRVVTGILGGFGYLNIIIFTIKNLWKLISKKND